MSDAAEDRDEDETAPPVRKRGAAELRRLALAEEAKYRPDLYRCRAELCRTTVTDKDREGHLGRCRYTAPDTPIEQAFEPRDRAGIAKTVRRGRPKRPPREKPLITAPVERDEPEERHQEEAPPTLTIVRTPAPARAAAIAEAAAKLRTTTPTEEQEMQNGHITSAEAAGILGVEKQSIAKMVSAGLLKAKRGGRGVPLEIDRASVLERQARLTAGGDAPPQQKKQKKTRAAKPKLKAAKKATRHTEALRAELAGDLADDVRALIRCLDRGWMEHESLVDNLRKLVA